MLKTAKVMFEDPKYNYYTSVNGNLPDEQIISYFKNTWFNLGHVEDNMQKCIECKILKQKKYYENQRTDNKRKSRKISSRVKRT